MTASTRITSGPRNLGLILSILTWVLLVAAQHLHVASGLSSDGLALLAFKTAITNDPGGVLANWNPQDSTPCAWNGVACDFNEAVVSLALAKQRLSGTIAAELGSIPQLSHINLHSNAIFGPIPPQLFNATFLRALYLFNNNLSGILPSAVGQLGKLQHINIATNGLVGEIPSELSSCKNLQDLVFAGNKFAGPIPDSLGNSLKALQTLDLSSNELSGVIPEDMGNLSSLGGVLQLSQNQLSGSIPVTLGNLPSAVGIDLSNNNLSGPIPPIFHQQNRNITVNNNPGLCGAPLSNPCPSPPPGAPVSPPFSPAARKSKPVLTQDAVLAIVVGGSIGILVVILVFGYYCIRKNSKCVKLAKRKLAGTVTNSSDESSSSSTLESANGWVCCAKISRSKDGTCSPPSDMIEPGELIHLDEDVKFDLEELLRASAYVLGKGGAGIVYKAVLEDGLTVVVRRLGAGGAQKYKEFEAEVQFIGKVRHPNIVSLRAYYWAVDEKLLVYDFIPNGNLVTGLHGGTAEVYSRKPLSWGSRLNIAQGCARGLAFIHACGTGRTKLVHGDVKPSNILLDKSLEARLSEVGLVRLQFLAGGKFSSSNVMTVASSGPAGAGPALSSSGPGVDREGSMEERGVGRRLVPSSFSAYVCPSVCYYPPEAAVRKQIPTQKWDVYSFGVVVLELLTGRSPAMQLATSEVDLVAWVRQTAEERKPLTDVLDIHLSQEIRSIEGEYVEALQIALSCTEANPDDRPLMSEVADKLEQIGRKLQISDSECSQ